MYNVRKKPVWSTYDEINWKKLINVWSGLFFSLNQIKNIRQVRLSMVPFRTLWRQVSFKMQSSIFCHVREWFEEPTDSAEFRQSLITSISALIATQHQHLVATPQLPLCLFHSQWRELIKAQISPLHCSVNCQSKFTIYIYFSQNNAQTSYFPRVCNT